MTNRRFGQTMYLPTGDPDDVNISEADYPYPGMIGAKITINRPVRTEPTGTVDGQEKQYQLVRTDSTMTVMPYDGAVAWWAETQSYRVTTDPTTLGRGRIAGVFTTAVEAGNLTLIKKRGPHADVKFVDAPTATPTAAGLHVIPSATAGKADCLAAGSAPTYPLLGKTIGAYDAANTEADVELFVEDGVD